MHALLLGATGATGKDLLQLLLRDDAFHRVDIFVRRSPEILHDKLTTHIVDFDRPEQWKHLVKGDVLFSCLGTTLKAAGSKAAQWRVDFDYQYQCAKVARENDVQKFVLVSSDHASPNSPFFYAKMKGRLEEASKALGFPKITIFHPPLLIRKNSDRALEVAGQKVIQLFSEMGFLRSQKPMPTEVLAQAMINSAKTMEEGLSSFRGEAIWKRAGATR